MLLEEATKIADAVLEMRAETAEITWMTGVMHVSQERRVDGNSIIYGYRINGGEFKPTLRMDCHDRRELDEAIGVMASASVTK